MINEECEQIDLSSFPNIFRNSDDIKGSREYLNIHNNTELMFSNRMTTNIGEEIDFDKMPNRFDCIVNNISLSCLAFDNRRKNNKLYISLSSGIPKNINEPNFSRWKYHKYFDGIYICIADPMIFINRKLPYNEPTWYYGYKENNVFESIKELINKIVSKYRIEAKNITVFGSSSGGYAALYLGYLIEDINVIALSPQLSPKLWDTSNNFEKYNECDLRDKSIERNDLTGLVKFSKSKNFICYNRESSKDIDQINLLTNENIIPYGISEYSRNIIFWKHSTFGVNKHNCNPEKFGIVIMDWLLTQLRNNKDINTFRNFSIILSEILAEKHMILRKFFELKNLR